MEDQLLHVCTYVCAKCCYPQKIKSLLTIKQLKSNGLYYCKFGNFSENFIFANIFKISYL